MTVDITTGGGSGRVVSTPPGIDCNMDGGTLVPQGCSAEFVEIDTVTLIPTTNELTVFDGWAGACQGGEICTLPMTQDRSVMALMPLRAIIGVVGQHNMTFTAAEGTNPPTQSKAISNVGDKALEWVASFNQTWVSVTPLSGSIEPGANSPLTITVESDELAAGSYEAVISIIDAEAANSPRSIEVALTVT